MADETRLPARLEPSALTTADFDAIEGAVMETARGRWFLAEYARRNRAADTVAVLDAIGRLESAVAAPRAAPEVDRIRMDIREMAQAIARTKTEIAAIKPEGGEGGRFEEASVELDAIVKATATATGDILSAAETIQEIAWTLREMGAEGEVCDLIDTKTTDIYTACSFQDITGQRTRKVIGVLRFLEERIDSMMAIWGDTSRPTAPVPQPAPQEASLLNGPARPGEGLGQNDVDLMLDDGLFSDAAETAVEELPAEPVATPAPVEQPRAAEVLPPAVEEVPATARATASAALSTSDVPLAPTTRPARADAPLTRSGASTLEDIEKLSFIEKVALTS